MKEKLIKVIKNPFFLISIVYFSAHFFMLLLSGCWWDDWTFMSHNTAYINEVASQSGRPEWNLLVPFCWSLPNNGKPLIFILYFLDTIFVYHILKECTLFDKKESLIITLLFAAIPANDARILISNFAYSVGLFFFYLSFMLFVKWINNEESKKKIGYRIILLILFYISFILNSVLAYYYIIFAYLFVLEFRSSAEKNIVKRILFSAFNAVKKYPDFFVLPFIYYGVNKTLFPVHGDTFVNYNAVTLDGLIISIIYIPISAIKVFSDLFHNWLRALNDVTLIVLLATIILVFWVNKKKDENKSILVALQYMAYGVLVLVMGLFPYVMIRTNTIDMTGVKGRDSILTPLGIAIILLALISVFKDKQKKMITAAFVVMCIASFNMWYIEWQKDYYYQLSMENLMNNKIIRDNDTFFLIDLNESKIEGQRYYSLNTNAFHVFGDETRFFIPKASNLYLLEDKKSMKLAIEQLDYYAVMRDYNPENYYFDAILNYYNDLSWEETLELKYLELFDPKRFESEIKSRGTLEIVEVEDDFTIQLLKEYNNGKIRSDEDVLNCLIEYER